MGKAFGLLKILTINEMEKLHNGALKILEDTGMWIDSQDARDYYRSAGCKVNDGTKIVLFPKKITEYYIDMMRKKYSDISNVRYSRTFYTKKENKLYTDFTTNAGGFSVFVLDLNNKRRTATFKDVTDSIRLADALENIDRMGLPCSAQEIPHEERPIRMTAELLKLTNKIGGIEAWNKRDIYAIAEMCDVITGSRDASIKNPLIMGYSEMRTPLCFDGNMSEIFIEYAKLGFPQTIDTMPCAGTTSPAYFASTIAIGLAESIAGIVLGFSVNPEVRMGIALTPSATDMRTLIFPYASSDKMTLIAAMIQMLSEYYGCPTGAHAGKTDACVPNVQAGFEKALSALIPILFGAIGIGTLGNLEPGGITFSPVQLVIDNEIIGYIRRVLKGFDVNEETLALDIIKEVGPEGSFITHQSPADNFRKEFYLSDISEHLSRGSWENHDIKGIEERAREKVKKILKEHYPGSLSEDQAKEIDKIVKSYLEK